ncbi:MAG TPA: TonB family protein [Gammaproteobacteria bacterium]|nr:TonB family protein [Gammaproteobacteria bacterium]
MTDVAMTQKITRNTVLLSIVLHLLLLSLLAVLSMTFTFKPVEKTRKPPELYIPSYVYHGAMTPAVEHAVTHRASRSAPAIESPTTPLPIQKSTPNSTLSSGQKTLSHVEIDPFRQRSVLDLSRSVIQNNQTRAALNQMKNSEPPILMVGDKHATVDPLAKLMGRSLSAHFHYPDVEGIFGARGVVYIALVLHPEGTFSDIQIVQPSEIQDFNAAALYAVNTAPTVVGVNKFLAKPTRFVVGFIFD